MLQIHHTAAGDKPPRSIRAKAQKGPKKEPRAEAKVAGLEEEGSSRERRTLQRVCLAIAQLLGKRQGEPVEMVVPGRRKDENYGSGQSIFRLGEKIVILDHIHLDGHHHILQQHALKAAAPAGRGKRAVIGNGVINAIQIVAKGFQETLEHMEQGLGDDETLVTVLVLEDASGALYDPLEINQALVEILATAAIVPHRIYLVETHDPHEWVISPIPQLTYSGWNGALAVDPGSIAQDS
jgi:hypothetical protein